MLRHLFNNPESDPDFTLSCGDRQWLLHRVCLSWIPYFKTLFTREGFKENQRGFLEIKEFSPGAVECILNWIHQIPFASLIKPELLEESYRLADMWLFEPYKSRLLQTLTGATYYQDDPYYAFVWRILGEINEEYQRKFIVNLLDKTNLVFPNDELPVPEICKCLLDLVKEKNTAKYLFFAYLCFKKGVISREEVETLLRNTTLTKEHFRKALLIKEMRSTLSPGYLDTLIADYFMEQSPVYNNCFRLKCPNIGDIKIIRRCENHQK